MPSILDRHAGPVGDCSVAGEKRQAEPPRNRDDRATERIGVVPVELRRSEQVGVGTSHVQMGGAGDESQAARRARQGFNSAARRSSFCTTSSMPPNA